VSALGGSPVLPGDHGSPGDLDSLGFKCIPTDADTREVESLRVDAHEGGGALRCWRWALHRPWSRELPASSLQAGLREPPPPGPMRWIPRNMARPDADTKRHCKATQDAKLKRHSKARWGAKLKCRCCERESAKSRHRYEKGCRSKVLPLKGKHTAYSKRGIERMSANSTCSRKGAQMRANAGMGVRRRHD
jgi:hypothetical protein